VELAQEINTAMPAYVARRAQDILNEDGKAVRGSTVLLLGVTYKPDISDQRGSPAVPLAGALMSMGATVTYHDPYVARWRVHDRDIPRRDDLRSAVAEARSEEHTSELQSRENLVCRLLLEKKKSTAKI